MDKGYLGGSRLRAFPWGHCGLVLESPSTSAQEHVLCLVDGDDGCRRHYTLNGPSCAGKLLDSSGRQLWRMQPRLWFACASAFQCAEWRGRQACVSQRIL